MCVSRFRELMYAQTRRCTCRPLWWRCLRYENAIFVLYCECQTFVVSCVPASRPPCPSKSRRGRPSITHRLRRHQVWWCLPTRSAEFLFTFSPREPVTLLEAEIANELPSSHQGRRAEFWLRSGLMALQVYALPVVRLDGGAFVQHNAVSRPEGPSKPRDTGLGMHLRLILKVG